VAVTVTSPVHKEPAVDGKPDTGSTCWDMALNQVS